MSSDAYKQALGRIEDAEGSPGSVAAALLAVLAADGGLHVSPGLVPELEAAVYRLASLPDPATVTAAITSRLLRGIAEYERRKWLARLT